MPEEINTIHFSAYMKVFLYGFENMATKLYGKEWKYVQIMWWVEISYSLIRKCQTVERWYDMAIFKGHTGNIIDTITLIDLQLDTQNFYSFTYNTFIKILYMFLALPCSSAGGLRRNFIYAASGIVTVCRWLSCAPVKKVLS